jgi:hypothetical protein
MTGDPMWTVFFCPHGQRPVPFGPVRTNFPDLKWESPEDIGEIPIRVTSSSPSSVPTFPVGTVGTLSGARIASASDAGSGWQGVMFIIGPAKVLESRPGDLTLEAKSSDMAINPLCFTTTEGDEADGFDEEVPER